MKRQSHPPAQEPPSAPEGAVEDSSRLYTKWGNSNSVALCFSSDSAIFKGSHSGGIAQLGERLDGIEKVRGSSPLASIGM